METNIFVPTNNSSKIREAVIRISYSAQMAHIGSSLSCVEILDAVFAITDLSKNKMDSRMKDIIILSKGHAAAAYYAALFVYGILDVKSFAEINKNGSCFGGHPPAGINYIDHPTGALGHGASVGCGMAYVQKHILKNPNKVFVILGDGELDEGSNWEAFMQASTLKLSNLYILVDRNHLSGIESTDCCELESLSAKLEAFGMEVKTVDGHDSMTLKNELMYGHHKNQPFALICNTVKGKGISFMENDNTWHYRPLNEKTYCLAMEEVKGRAE